MKRFTDFAVALCFALATTFAGAAPRQTVVKQTTGSATQTATFDGMKPITITPTSDNKQTVTQTGSPTKVFPNSNVISVSQTGSWPVCPVKPLPATRPVQCPNGYTGGPWTQTQTFNPAVPQIPPDQCWIASEWLPATAPAGTCTLLPTGIPPVANFRFVVTGNSVTFFGATNSDDQDGWLTGWNWNFGDGSPNSTNQNPTHVYATSGVYTVTEIVTDNDGLTGTGSQPVTIGAAPPACPPIPADVQDDETCSSGTGSWHRTHGWTQSAYPGCVNTPLAWIPASEPATCGAAPPTGTLKFNVVPDRTTAAFARYVTIVNSGDPDDVKATDAANMFLYTGQAQYAAQCNALVEAQVAAAEQAIASGSNPSISGDSYLASGDMIQSVAVSYAWCNPTTAQKVRWKTYVDQTLYNIWNHSDAHWGGRLAVWTGWGTDDPNNNYYYSFTRGTMLWALASNSTANVHGGQSAMQYLRSTILPNLVSTIAAIPGGGSLEGDGYGTSHMGLFEFYKWWMDSTGENLSNAHLTNSIYFWVHATIPEGAHFWPIGTQSRDAEAQVFDYQRKLVELAIVQTPDIIAQNAGRYWLAHILDNQNNDAPYNRMARNFMAFWDLIDHSGTAIPPGLTFSAKEVGAYMGRTVWGDVNACWAGTLMGNYSQSHAHPEQGSVSYACKNAWLTVTNNTNSKSGINGEDGNGRDKNVIDFFKGSVEQKQQRGTVRIVSVTMNPATGDYDITGDMSSLYAAGSGVTSWIRRVQFTGGKLTITDTTVLVAGTTGVAYWNVPVTPAISGSTATAGHLKLTVLSAASGMTNTDMTALSSEYVRGSRINLPISSGTQTTQVTLQAF